jgi:organic hydroperoxide reductase OsmC/OhrA
VAKQHRYPITITWTGNRGTGTSGYKAYDRAHEVSVPGKPVISGSSDPGFNGDPSRYNPEEMLVAALSACHMLWYLHLCAVNRIVVTGYVDRAEGSMIEEADGSGRFTGVVLKPEISVKPGADLELAHRLHREAHAKCFIANSVNFPVSHEPAISQET